jgi:DNA-binding transcriptional LysR family regulator
MNTPVNTPDWTLLQSFALVVSHGSLSAAARNSGTSQPTLSRHIASLEQTLGYRVLRRTTTGIELTTEGAQLAVKASKMAELAAGVQETPETSTLAGTVRITASQIMATYTLPSILSELRRSEPEIQIEVVASDETENLLRRDADIAVRMYRPTQSDVIAKKVTELGLGVYASKEYLNRMGTPDLPQDLINHDIVGYDRSELIITGLEAAGLKVTRDFFAFRSDDQVVCWQMVLEGFGVGFNQSGIGDNDPRVQRIAPEMAVGSIPVWLAAHTGLKTNPRVRYVFDFLASRLGELR